MQAIGEQTARCLYLDNAQIIVVPTSMRVAGVVTVWVRGMTIMSEETPGMQTAQKHFNVSHADSGVAIAWAIATQIIH